MSKKQQRKGPSLLGSIQDSSSLYGNLHPDAFLSHDHDSLYSLDATSHILSSSSSSTTKYQGTYTAWWILLWYSYMSGLQSLLWMTFSSVPDKSRAFLNVDNTTLDLWLDWGPVAYCCSIPIALLLLSSKRSGLQLSVRIGATACLLASLIRCIPLLFTAEERQANSTAMLACIHVAQFINGAVAPFVVSSPAYLSLLWFPENTRNTATAIGNVANALGRGIGFFLGPWIVNTADDLVTLLYLEIGLAALPFLAVMLYYPAVPSLPPSRAAEEEQLLMQEKEEAYKNASEEGSSHDQDASRQILGLDIPISFVSGNHYSLISSLMDDPVTTTNNKNSKTKTSSSSCCSCSWISSTASTAWKEIMASIRVPSFLLLAISGGLEMAVYGLWSGVLPTVLNPPFSDTQAGNFGTVTTFAGILGGLLIGYVTDIPALRYHLKIIIQILSLLSAVAFGILAFSVPPFDADINSYLSNSLGYVGLLVIAGIAGLLRGGTDPLYFELSAEVVAPASVPAGAAGGVLTFWYHIILCIFLSIPPSFLQNWTMISMAVLMVISALFLIPVKVQYTRR